MMTSARNWPEFFSRLVHDLREPLRSIRSFSELLGELAHEDDRRTSGADRERALHEILSSAATMGTLIDGISRYGPTLAPAPLPGAASLQLAFGMATMTFDRELTACGGTLSGEDLPQLAVPLEQLNFLLENLIGNALKFRGPEAPAIRVTAAGPESDFWTIRVEDNGIGIAEADRESVFRPFMRVYGRKYPGAGLGLSACRNIVESFGGRIRIEPAPEGGCICAFTLPALP
jgi:signal transduction histidine kinase